jgi:cell volume regulation protein A
VHLELPSDELLLATGLLLVAGVLGAGFAARVRVPSLLLFLGLGMAIGDDGLNWISLSDAELTQGIAVVALVVILYDGGLGTRLPDLRSVAAPALSLATIGVLVTAGVVTVVAGPVLDVDRTTALLIGAVVASTDAAAVFSALRGVPLPRRLSHLLEAESGANDPMAVLLTVGILEAWAGDPVPGDWVAFGLRTLLGGLFVGVVVGWSGAALLSRARLLGASFYPVLAVGIGVLSYGAAAALEASGFLAVYVAGVLVADRAPSRRRAVRRNLEVLASTAQIGLFLLLGLLVFPSDLDEEALGALGVAVVLVLVARPLAVLVSIGWLGFDRRELALVSWAGLRGAIPIVLATFPLTVGHPDGALIFNVVFFVVVLSVLAQGLTVAPLARRLGLEAEPAPSATVTEALPLDAPGVEALEIEVGSSAGLVGRTLRDVPPPHEARVAVILRDEEVVVATGATEVAAGDRLVVFGPTRPDLLLELQAWVAAPARRPTTTGEAVAP